MCMWCPCPLVIEHWQCDNSSFSVEAEEEHADGRDNAHGELVERGDRRATATYLYNVMGQD